MDTARTLLVRAGSWELPWEGERAPRPFPDAPLFPTGSQAYEEMAGALYAAPAWHLRLRDRSQEEGELQEWGWDPNIPLWVPPYPSTLSPLHGITSISQHPKPPFLGSPHIPAP